MITDLNVSLDHLGDVTEQGGGALLTLLFDNNPHGWNGHALHRGGGVRGGFDSDFVAPDVSKLDRLEDVNSINHPTNLRLPVDRLKNAASSGRRDDVIGDPLEFHFWPSEAGEVA